MIVKYFILYEDFISCKFPLDFNPSVMFYHHIEVFGDQTSTLYDNIMCQTCNCK